MLYEYSCECGEVTEASRSCDERHDSPPCKACGDDTTLKITGGVGFSGGFLGSAANPGYMCPVTDQFIDSKKKRNEVMAVHGLREHTSADKVKHHTGF